MLLPSLLFLTSWVCLVQPADNDNISLFAVSPNWVVLESYNHTISRGEFEKAVQNIYSPDGTFFKYLDLSDKSAKIYSDMAKTKFLWELKFADGKYRKISIPYRFQDKIDYQIREATPDKPLKGLTICLDPGHIGGSWSNVEERYFKIRKDLPICEGDLNMITCEHLAKRLEEVGAKVVWTHRDHEPVTTLRPKDFYEHAIHAFAEVLPKLSKKKKKSPLDLKKVQWISELFFYRTAEIQARADRVNKELKPDLTLCVHYNAKGWWRRPRLCKKVNHLIVFVHGSYNAEELCYDNQKFDLMRKLLERSSSEEVDVAESIADQMQMVWKWPAQGYDTKIANRVSTSPYVWTRNLLANRLYDGPVVFVEGPFMNDREIYKRFIAGDYDGEKEIGGKKVRSITREFAEIIANGVIEHYKNP